MPGAGRVGGWGEVRVTAQTKQPHGSSGDGVQRVRCDGATNMQRIHAEAGGGRGRVGCARTTTTDVPAEKCARASWSATQPRRRCMLCIIVGAVSRMRMVTRATPGCTSPVQSTDMLVCTAKAHAMQGARASLVHAHAQPPHMHACLTSTFGQHNLPALLQSLDNPSSKTQHPAPPPCCVALVATPTSNSTRMQPCDMAHRIRSTG